MTNKGRMVSALNLKKGDRVPVTLHNILEYYRRKYLNNIERLEAYSMFGLDAMEYFDAEWLWSHGIDIPTIPSTQTTDEWIIRRKLIDKERWLELNRELYEELIQTPSGTLRQLVWEVPDVGGFDPWVVKRLIKN